MNNDKHNIDELFKKGLANYTERPARRLWRRISWHMLRDELTHFNFVNFPIAWTTVPAALAIIASIAIFNFSSPPSDEMIPESFPITEISDKPLEINPSDKSGTDITDEQSKQEQEIRYEDDYAADRPIITLQEIVKDASPDEPARQKTPLSNEELMIAEEAASVDAPEMPSGDVTAEEEFVAQSTEQQIPATEKEHDESFDKFGYAEIPRLTKLNFPVFDYILPQDEREPADVTLRDLHVDKSDAGEVLTAFDAGAGEMHQTGRMQRMHSLNHSLGLLFRGRYKPPKRDFQTQAMNKRSQNHLSLAIYVSPEITEYTRMASTSREKSFASGIALSYNTPKYIIQAGVEASYFYDLGDYMVHMETFDSIGFYNHVNGFTVDPETGQIIFDTHEVGVWDSISHNSHQQTQTNYTYLQFPVLFGYKAMESGNFSVHLKAGPNFSLLLNRREPGLDFYLPGATVNAIENYSLPRINANVQLLVSLGLQWQVTEKLGILAEPVYRQYLNTVYDLNSDNGTLKNPYSFGLRAGIYFTF
jgi:hypothetical protein